MFKFTRTLGGYTATQKTTGVSFHVMRDVNGRGWFAWRPGQRTVNVRTRNEACLRLAGLIEAAK